MESTTSPKPVESRVKEAALPDELRGLTPDAIELLRAQQREAIDKATEGLEGDEAIRATTETKAALAMAYPEYLKAHGVSPDNPHYGDYMDHLQVHSYVNQPDDSMWRVGVPAGELLDPSKEMPITGRDVASITFDSFKDRLASEAAKANADPAAASTALVAADGSEAPLAAAADPEQATEHEQTSAEKLTELRSAYVEAAAARLRAPVYYKRKQRQELTETSEAAQREYLDQLLVVEAEAVEFMIAQQNPDGSRTFTDEQVKSMLLRKLNDRIRSDETDLKQAMVEQGGWLARRLESYANLSTKKKVAVGVGLGAVAAATGFGLGFVAGAGGALAATGGAGALAASRFGRTYALRLSRLYKKEDVPAFTADQINAHEHVLESAHAWIQDRFKGNVESADKTKRGAVKWALGATAAGGLVGYAAQAAELDLSEPVDKFRTLMNWGKSPLDVDAGSAVTVDPNVETPLFVEPEPVVVEARPEIFAEDALTIRNGEGWYQTFKEVGVSREHWTNLLNQTGPKLQEMGIAYRAPELGGWGMNMTPDGRMPEEALRYITETAREHGYLPSLELSAPAPEVAAVPEVHTESPEPSVENTSVEVDPATAAQDDANRFNRDAVSPANQDRMSRIGVYMGEATNPGANYQPMRGVVSAETLGVVHTATGNESARIARELGLGRNELQTLLNETGNQLKSIRYSDANHTAVVNRSGDQWRLNIAADGELPKTVRQILRNAAARSQSS